MNRLVAQGQWWRSVCMTLAALALVVKIAIPTGFMVADANAGGFPLVLCTAGGAVVIDSVPGAPTDHKAPRSHEAPCAFVGHGAAFVAPDLVGETLAQPIVYAPISPERPASISPGRGLVAPPPPARGPPLTA